MNLTPERGIYAASTSQVAATLKRHKCRAPVQGRKARQNVGALFADGPLPLDFTIDASALEAVAGSIDLQASRNLLIDTDADLNLANQTSGESVSFRSGGNLTVNATVQTGGASLSFTASDASGDNVADATLTINAAISTGALSGTADTTGGNITLANDGSGGVLIDAAVTTTRYNSGQTDQSGNIVITSGGSVNLAGVLRSGELHIGSARDIRLNSIEVYISELASLNSGVGIWIGAHPVGAAITAVSFEHLVSILAVQPVPGPGLNRVLLPSGQIETEHGFMFGAHRRIPVLTVDK